MAQFDPEKARQDSPFYERSLLSIEGYFQGFAEIRCLRRYKNLQQPAKPARKRELVRVGFWLSKMSGYRIPYQYGVGEGQACCGACDMGEPSYEYAHQKELEAAEFHARCACIDIFEYCRARGVDFCPDDQEIRYFSRYDPSGEYDGYVVNFEIPNGTLTQAEAEGAGEYVDELFPRLFEINFHQYDALNRAGIHLRNLDPTDGLDDLFGAYSFLWPAGRNAPISAKVRGLGPFFEGRTPLVLTQDSMTSLKPTSEVFWPELRAELRKRKIRWRRQLGPDWERKLTGIVAQTSLAPEEFPVSIDLCLWHFFDPI